jgi:hypothetical protein
MMNTLNRNYKRMANLRQAQGALMNDRGEA